MSGKIIVFFLKGIVFTFFIIAICRSMSINTQIFFPIALILFSIPIAVFNFYKITMIKKMQLSKFHSKGKLYNFLSKRSIRYIFWIIFSPIITGYTLIKMYGFSIKEWLIIFLIIPIFIIVFNFIKKHIIKEIKEEYVFIYTLRYSVIISSIIMVFVFPLLVYILGEYDISTITSMDDAVKIQLSSYISLKTSPIAYAIASKVAFFNGIVIYFLSLLSGKWLLFAILVTVGEGFVFFSLISIFALYLLRKKELSKIYLPIVEDKTKESSTFTLPILSSLGLIFVFLFAYFVLNDNLKNNNKLIKALNLPQQIAVEIIDGEYITIGTLEKLEKLRAEMNFDIGKKINKKIDIAFDMMIKNVDGYLDWYYGLTAEYLRTIKFLTGGLEDFMKTKLKEHLQSGGANSIMSATLKEVPKLIKKSKDKFDTLAGEIIKTNIVQIKPFDSVIIKKNASIKSLIKVFSDFEDKIQFSTRAGISIAGGLITAVIVKRIINKSAYKLSVRLLTKLFGKKIISKWAGTGAGAAIGSGIGSTIPGAGTAIGGMIGAGVGFIASLFIDYSVLKLEESINREIYKIQIIAAINESRKEFKKWNF